MSDTSSKPLAFVIMPFDEGFDPIYTDFLDPVLRGAGFEVKRADDILNQQHILKDILEGLHDSDLIVADLTGANPNVFYELGLAHAFRKHVILLTENIDDVPFDLRGYRLIEYDTHFARFGKARLRLAEMTQATLEGKVSFGSPVTDFIPGESETPQVKTTANSDQPDSDDDGGFLDHLLAVNDFYDGVTNIMGEVNQDLQVMTGALQVATRELSNISDNPNASSPTAMRSVCRRLAERIKQFADKLQTANNMYASKAQNSENSLEFVLSFTLDQANEGQPVVDEQLSSLRKLRTQAMGAHGSILGMAQSMDALPRIERHLNREVARGSHEVRMMAANIDRTIASISRALQVYDER